MEQPIGVLSERQPATSIYADARFIDDTVHPGHHRSIRRRDHQPPATAAAASENAERGGGGLEGPRLGGEQAPPCYDQVVLNTAHTGNTAAASINADATRMTQDTVSRMMRAQVALVITVRVRAGAWAGMLHLTEPLRQSSSGSAWDLLARGAADNGHGGSHAATNAAAGAGAATSDSLFPHFSDLSGPLRQSSSGSAWDGLAAEVEQQAGRTKLLKRDAVYATVHFTSPSPAYGPMERVYDGTRYLGITTGPIPSGALSASVMVGGFIGSVNIAPDDGMQGEEPPDNGPTAHASDGGAAGISGPVRHASSTMVGLPFLAFFFFPPLFFFPFFSFFL